MPRQHQVSLYDRALQKQEKLGPLFSFLKNSAIKTSLPPAAPIYLSAKHLYLAYCLTKDSALRNARHCFPFVFRATIALSARHLFCSPSHTASPRIPRIQTHAIAPLCLPYNNRALSRALTMLSQLPPHGKKAGQKAKVEIRKRFPLSYSSLSSV